MVGVHIATSESLLAGAISFLGYCPCCCRENALQRTGYAGGHCECCGEYYCHDSLNSTVRSRRKLLGFTRKDMAIVAGVKPQTIRNYENVWPSKRYWELTAELVKAEFVPANPQT